MAVSDEFVVVYFIGESLKVDTGHNIFIRRVLCEPRSLEKRTAITI